MTLKQICSIKKCRAEEAAKKDYTFVRNLLLNTGRHEQFSDEEIALLVGVTVDFVQKVKSDLAKEKP